MVVNNDRRSIKAVPSLLDVTDGAWNHHEICSPNIDRDLRNLDLETAMPREVEVRCKM